MATSLTTVQPLICSLSPLGHLLKLIRPVSNHVDSVLDPAVSICASQAIPETPKTAGKENYANIDVVGRKSD